MEVGKPWSNVTVSRSLSSLKFFYDLKFGMLGSVCMTDVALETSSQFFADVLFHELLS